MRTETFYPLAIAAGLALLAGAGARLFIVTNKRMLPTRRILEALGLAPLFAGIHTRDETDPPAPSKAAVTQRVLGRYGIDPAQALFVGDSDEDAAAARENGLRFIHAAYGYGAAGIPQGLPSVVAGRARCSSISPTCLASSTPCRTRAAPCPSVHEAHARSSPTRAPCKSNSAEYHSCILKVIVSINKDD